MAVLISNWLLMGIVSALSTAALIFLSSEAFGGYHSSIIMLVRVIGVSIIVIPVVMYTFQRGTTGIDQSTLSLNYITLVFFVGITAGISWYSFYLALEAAKAANVPSSLVTAINYSSLGVLFLINLIAKRETAGFKNWTGVALVVIGLFLLVLKPSQNSGGPDPHASVSGSSPRGR